MRSVRESFELILVTILAGFASDVISGAIGCRFGLTGLDGLRRATRDEPHESGSKRAANEQ
jgi:hypothetical protein